MDTYSLGKLLEERLPPKVIEIDGEGPRVAEMEDRADEGMGPRNKRVIAAIEEAAFTAEGDKPVVVQLYREYVVKVQNAMEGEKMKGEYEGEYNAAGKYEGRGVMRYASGDVYEGEGKAGKKDLTVSRLSLMENKSLTTRMKFRESVFDVISRALRNHGRTWRDEYIAARDEGMALLEAAGKRPEHQPYRDSVEALTAHNRQSEAFKHRLAAGLEEEEADVIAVVLSTPIVTAMGNALEGKENPCDKSVDKARYAHLTHAAVSALAQQAKREKQAKNVPPPLYAHLSADGKGLADKDARWHSIAVPDSSGFKGLTTFAPLPLRPAVETKYDAAGVKIEVKGAYVVAKDSVVVCVLPPDAAADPSEHMFRAAVRVETGEAEDDYMLPPMTLLTVIEEKDAFEYLPGKTVKCRCICVRPTFMVPEHFKSGDSASGSRFSVPTNMLSFGGTTDFVTSLDPICGVRALTMDAEWMRDDQWTDWQGKPFGAREQWEYVTKPVAAGAKAGGSGFGERDAGRDGWTPQKFVDTANAHIREGVRQRNLAAASDWELTQDEVLAVRLFTGPGYQKINEFLREMAKLSVDMRRRVARCPEVTYAATCFHLVNGLRKLARVTNPDGALYRMVRGTLPADFQTKRDAHGLVTVVEPGCMSSSRDESVVSHYKDPNGQDVLWRIHPCAETEDAFHCGADVAVLSQYPKEEEVTFPPYTMLVVQKGKDGQLLDRYRERNDGSKYRQIDVVPHFV